MRGAQSGSVTRKGGFRHYTPGSLATANRHGNKPHENNREKARNLKRLGR